MGPYVGSPGDLKGNYMHPLNPVRDDSLIELEEVPQSRLNCQSKIIILNAKR